MSHLKIMELLTHIDGAMDILNKYDHHDDAMILDLLSKKYLQMYHLSVRNLVNGNS